MKWEINYHSLPPTCHISISKFKNAFEFTSKSIIGNYICMAQLFAVIIKLSITYEVHALLNQIRDVTQL